MTTGVLLVNIGGAESVRQSREFLWRMFTDSAILPLPFGFRHLLAGWIAWTRAGKSWEMRKRQTESPVFRGSMKTAEKLREELEDGETVECAYSYSSPLIEQGFAKLAGQGVERIVVLPLYPHPSACTTGSIKTQVNALRLKFPTIETVFVEGLYQHGLFNSWWIEMINEHLSRHDSPPVLLFSAHAIPARLADAGDPYVAAVNESAARIAESLHLRHKVAYQSRMGRTRWTEPTTEDALRDLLQKDEKDIMILPFSFVGENLETFTEIDEELIPALSDEYPGALISRPEIPDAHSEFIALLASLIRNGTRVEEVVTENPE